MTPETTTKSDNVVQLATISALINFSSVGQTRDGDPGVFYMIYSDETVTFHRVRYPVEVIRQKIMAISWLDSSVGDRLLRRE